MSTHRSLSRVALVCSVACASIVVAGCGGKKKADAKPSLPAKYPALPRREVPQWLAGTIFQEVDLADVAPYRVNNYGLVVLKRPTGGGARNVPNGVREYMIREMTKRGFGSKNQPGFENASPDAVLSSPQVAIVRVDAFIPPGAVRGSRVDVQVTALDDSDTTSLAGGTLFTTDLYRNGANPSNPGGIELMANARGYVFVNPAYALDDQANADPTKQRSLTSGSVLAGGRIAKDRVIALRIRAAERRLSLMTADRIDLLVGDASAADAKDEGIVAVTVPAKYRGDWEHFAGVLLHTYYNADAAFSATKAQALLAEIEKPETPLIDVSYTWEALGRHALPAIGPLYTHPRPEVAFAAARAGAFIGDPSAHAALAAMAREPANGFRVNAVRTLAALEPTPATNSLLRDLLAVDDTQVRIEAYRGLALNGDASIVSEDVGDKFKLDFVLNDAPPLVYATQSGVPRIAFFGNTARLPSQTFFTAMNDEFSISPVESRRNLLSIFYRGASVRDPVSQLTTPDLAEIVARLGGRGPEGEAKLNFTYGEIVAMLGKLADQNLLLSSRSAGERANFILQEPTAVTRDLDNAPTIPDGPRPVSDASR